MKKLVNEYHYLVTWDNDYYDKKESLLKAVHPTRLYATKMHKEDLPKNYCNINRCNYWDGSAYDMINSCGVKDLNYSWIKENHFMKDSTLRISFTGKLEPYHPIINGHESHWTDYKNLDSYVFGNSIFKYLAYVKHFSDYDISDIRNEFVKQCKWLKNNEPEFAPTLEHGQSYANWFDKTIKEFEDQIEE